MPNITHHITDTALFRSEETFDTIGRYLSRLPKDAKESPYAILSAPCSTGLEPVSLAVLAEELGFQNYRIVGIDIEPATIKRGREFFGANWFPSNPKHYQTNTGRRAYFFDKYFFDNGQGKELKDPSLLERIELKVGDLTVPFDKGGIYDLAVSSTFFIHLDFHKDGPIVDKLLRNFSHALKADGAFCWDPSLDDWTNKGATREYLKRNGFRGGIGLHRRSGGTH